MFGSGHRGAFWRCASPTLFLVLKWRHVVSTICRTPGSPPNGEILKTPQLTPTAERSFLLLHSPTQSAPSPSSHGCSLGKEKRSSGRARGMFWKVFITPCTGHAMGIKRIYTPPQKRLECDSIFPRTPLATFRKGVKSLETPQKRASSWTWRRRFRPASARMWGALGSTLGLRTGGQKR